MPDDFPPRFKGLCNAVQFQLPAIADIAFDQSSCIIRQLPCHIQKSLFQIVTCFLQFHYIKLRFRRFRPELTVNLMQSIYHFYHSLQYFKGYTLKSQ